MKQVSKAEFKFSPGVLFIHGEEACGKTRNGELLRQFFEKEFTIEGEELKNHEKLPESCIVLVSKPPRVSQDQHVISFNDAIRRATGLGE